MGQQHYIKTNQCDKIHELGYIKSDMFNEFVWHAIDEKIERDKAVQS